MVHVGMNVPRKTVVFSEVHRVLTEKVFPRQAEVTTVEAWAATLA